MTRHILIVDDDSQLCEAFQTLFVLAGYKTTVAVNGQDAVLQTIHERPDVVLMDIDMPIMDGIDAAIEISQGQTGGSPRIVMHSAKPESAVRARFIGYDAFLSKPCDFGHMLISIEGG